MEQKLKEYIIWMIACAENLTREPHNYGPLRMIDAAGRAIALFKENGLLSNEDLDAIYDDIEENKFLQMNDPEGFHEMLKRCNVNVATMLKKEK